MDTKTEQAKAAAIRPALNSVQETFNGVQDALGVLWDVAYEQGRLDALDELTERLCVCMKQ
jgi:hypothetical protein